MRKNVLKKAFLCIIETHMNPHIPPFFKKTSKELVLTALILLLGACGKQEVSSSSLNESLTPGDAIRLLNGVSYDTDHAVFDDFVGGVDYSRWSIGNGAWGNGNGGVVPANVGYTDDGVLVLRGNGLHYTGEEIKGVGTLKDGRNTGAALISKFLSGPGHYETKMKLLPRQGACTAFWTFTNRATTSGVNDNHEIDIELPGGKKSGVITFKDVLNTNYVTESYNQSQDVNLTNAFASATPICLNDGAWHTFGFDWYTNPEQVVYFVDGKVSAVSSIFVPSLQTRIWLGNWFPNNAGFVGSSEFETDYMYVDWLKYIPFDQSQTFEAYTPTISVQTAAEQDYPSKPMAYPSVNKVSNGDFEYVKSHDESGYGWNFSRLSSETQNVSDVCYAKRSIGHDASCGAYIKDGGYLSQNIDSVYQGFKYKFSFNAQAVGKGGKVVVNFINAYTTKAIKNKTYAVTATDWSSYGGEIEAPEDSYAIRLEAYTSKGNAISLDDVVLEKE
jgi:beta-glucanase (GH16 family)